jgi:glycosyltransferase involved in cell wall biosynthesis
MIDILLATYNGEKYIKEQLESLLAQSERDFVVNICDDCSTDRTVEILRHYVKRYPDRIKLIVNEKNSGSAAFSFFKLLHRAKGDYVMFCDQDDVWLEDKVKLSLEKIKEAEREYGSNIPILLHTDLTVVDEGLNVKARSMFALQHLDSEKIAVNNLAVQNIVTGCTMMLNRALADRLTHIPVSVPVHDWWIALYTACCGKIVFCDEPTLLYRQHSSNVCGAQNMADMGYVTERARDSKRAGLMIRYGYRQAAEMARVYGTALGEENYELLKGYGELENRSYFARLGFVISHRVYKSGLIRKLGQLIYM